MPTNPVPGPWRWDYDRDVVNLVSDDGTMLVLSIYESHGGGERPADADARLIASAPELLAALKALLSWSQSEYQSNPQIDARAKAAIDRAEGR